MQVGKLNLINSICFCNLKFYFTGQQLTDPMGYIRDGLSGSRDSVSCCWSMLKKKTEMVSL